MVVRSEVTHYQHHRLGTVLRDDTQRFHSRRPAQVGRLGNLEEGTAAGNQEELVMHLGLHSLNEWEQEHRHCPGEVENRCSLDSAGVWRQKSAGSELGTGHQPEGLPRQEYGEC